MPLPEVVDAWLRQSREALPAELAEIETRSAAELFKLAQRAPRPIRRRYALASLCLRAVLERQPDHQEARRLLGYVPHQGGWARPFAVEPAQEGNVNHPTFGWVPADWVPHLDRGELPAPLTSRPEEDSLAPRRRGRPPSSRLVAPLADQHRTL